MLKGSLMLGAGAIFGKAAASPHVSIDLTPIIVGFMALLGVLITAGYIGGRYQKKKALADVRKSDADARLADSQSVLTHAQYEGFIAEAAQRLSVMGEAAIARMETELARANTRIAELTAELERAKAERNKAFADQHAREMELTAEIESLRNRVIDLERRLEAQGVKPRRHTDERPPRRRTNPGGKSEPPE